MRRIVSSLAALTALVLCWPASAADFIETNSVVIPLASGWHERGGSSPISAAGPGQESMEVTVVAAHTSDEHPNLAQSLEAAEASAISALTSNVRDMNVVAPLKSFSLPNGTHARVGCLAAAHAGALTMHRGSCQCGAVRLPLSSIQACVPMPQECPSCQAGSC